MPCWSITNFTFWLFHPMHWLTKSKSKRREFAHPQSFPIERWSPTDAQPSLDTHQNLFQHYICVVIICGVGYKNSLKKNKSVIYFLIKSLMNLEFQVKKVSHLKIKLKFITINQKSKGGRPPRISSKKPHPSSSRAGRKRDHQWWSTAGTEQNYVRVFQVHIPYVLRIDTVCIRYGSVSIGTLQCLHSLTLLFVLPKL
jgi:hypothetical protein